MKRFLFLIIGIAITAFTNGQAPVGFNYQAIARNAQGQLLTNTQVSFQIAILKSSISGPSVYTETFSPSTNNFGLVNLNIGSGKLVSGSFADIDWGADTYYIKVWLNGAEMGVSQLLSVPYALYAKNVENGFSGNYFDLTNQPTLFDGQYSSLTGAPNLANVDNWNTAYSWGSHSDAGYQPLIVPGIATQYWRGDKTWQILNKAAVGLSIVENTQLSTWTGSSNITTLGLITSGVWNAGAITSSGAVTAGTIVKSGGTASQFLKADGSIDANTYLIAVREVADEFTATAAQTIFTLTQIPSVNSKVKMYINGVRISNAAYSKSNKVLTYIPSNNGSYALMIGDRVQFDYYY